LPLSAKAHHWSTKPISVQKHKIVFLVIIFIFFLAKFKIKCKEILAPLGRESKLLRNCWKKVHLGFSDFFWGER
jgi:intracellular septation protein A